MKKILLSSFLLLFLFHFALAQRDCCLATGLPPSGSSITVNTTILPNNVADDVSCSCLATEGGSYWMGFTCTGSGTLEFNLDPISSNEYDFSLWEGGCPCELVGGAPPPTISCNSDMGAGGNTGIASDPLTSFGVPNSPQFSPTVNLIAGKTYYLLVSNQSSDASDFILTTGGTAIWKPIDRPDTLFHGPAEVCTGGFGTYTLDPIPGINDFIWWVTPGVPAFSSTSLTQTFTFPTSGQYQVCVALDGPPPACQLAIHCKTVQVSPIPYPSAFQSDNICVGDVYVADDGQTFFFGGNFDLVYQSWQGCDSIVRLTLTQVMPDFDVIVKEVCEGECVEFMGETFCETGTYEENLTNQYGCDSTTLLFLISTPIETVITGADTIDCYTPSIVLTSDSSSHGGNPIYTWKKGNTVVGTEPNLTVTSGGTYTLTIKSTVGDHTCEAESSVVIYQNTVQPQATAIGGSLNCYNPSITLMGSSTTAGVNYAWSGPSGFSTNQQSPTITIPGYYVLTVTDPSNGCTKTASVHVNINKVPPTAAAAVSGVINCNESSVTLSGAGSSVGNQYSYRWTPAGSNLSDSTSLMPTAFAGGNYLLTVTNSFNGCTSTAGVTVIERQPVSLTISENIPVNCFGEANGSATITASGGDGNYTYDWSNGASSSTVSDLIAGNYTVEVTDGEGCNTSESVTISQPAKLLANAVTTPQTMFGEDNGTATANPTGGTGAYTYSWSNGGTTQAISDLAPGTYTVVVTDENGCTASQTVTVNAVNCAGTISFDYQDISCAGADDGTATVNLENGTTPFTVLWSTGDTTQTISQLTGATYSVTTTEANGCVGVATVDILDPAVLSANATANDPTSYNANNGTATANPTGGTAPYSYLWDNNETTASIGNLPPGSYTVSVTDVNGCEAVQTVTVEPFNCLLTATITTADVSCNGATDGQATAVLANGVAPFTYNWSNGETTATISDIPAGTYTVSASDATECPVIVEVTITEPDALGFDFVELVEPNCGATDGLVTVVGNGGMPGYSYAWSNGDIDSTISDVMSGTYILSITDANNCSATFDVTIGTADNEPPTLDCPTQVVLFNCDPVGVFAPTVTDNCLSSVQLNQTSGLPSGSTFPVGETTVTFEAVDASGNSATCSFIVTVPDVLSINLAATNVSCFGENDGSITANTTGGSPAYSYVWSNGDTAPTATGLVAGAYSVTVMDQGGCTSTQSVTLTQPTELITSLVSIVNDSSAMQTGAIDVTVMGGVPPYTYVWSNASGTVIGTSQDISGLGVGTYQLRVTDANDCVSLSGYTIQSVIGTTETELDKHVLVYPNPTSGWLNLDISGVSALTNVEVSAYDLTDRLAYSYKSTGTRHQLDFTNKPSGVYFLRIVVGNQVLTKRIVVNR